MTLLVGVEACSSPAPAPTLPPTAADVAPDTAPAHRFSIVFDYRFDDGFFSQHPERRATLEAAAAVWSDIIADDFPEVAARHEPRLLIQDDGHGYRGDVHVTRTGRTCQKWTAQTPHEHEYTPESHPTAGLGDHNHCRNPDTTDASYVWCYTTDPEVRFEECAIGIAHPVTNADDLAPIDDLVVFVYAAPSATQKAWAGPIATFPEGADGDALRARYERLPFQPWAGTLTVNSTPARPWFFDQTPDTFDDVPIATHYDFFMTAQHELGHILGFTPREGFQSLSDDHAFVGTHAMAANGGEPIPLALDSAHIRSGFPGALPRPHLEDLLMTPTATIQGYRVFPSRIDGAILRDLGYHVDDHGLEKYDPGGAFGGSPYRDAAADPRTPPAPWLVQGGAPLALWLFDDLRYLNDAVLGRPVLYQPASSGVLSTAAIDGAIQLRDGALLHAEYDATEGNCGGKFLNCYTVVYDLRLPRSGALIPLFNTSKDNANEAEAWINGDGHLGAGKTWSRVALAPERWYRVVYVVDLDSGRQTYYVDGELELSAQASAIDGQYSLWVDPPRFVLFGSSTSIGPDASSAIDVKRVAFYNRALTPDEASSLGPTD